MPGAGVRESAAGFATKNEAWRKFPKRPSPVATSKDGDDLAFELAVKMNTAAAYRAYLSEYPRGRYVGAAKVVLAGLEGAAPQQLSKPASLPPVQSPAVPVVLPTNDVLPGKYVGDVVRKLVSTGEAQETRQYTIVFNADRKGGSVLIKGSSQTYDLLFNGCMKDGTTFVGKTRLRNPTYDSTYTADDIRLEFSDGKSVHWYHNDGRIEGSGTLSRP